MQYLGKSSQLILLRQFVCILNYLIIITKGGQSQINGEGGGIDINMLWLMHST